MNQLTCPSCGSTYVQVTGSVVTCQSCDSSFTLPGAGAAAQPVPAAGGPVAATMTEGYLPFILSEAEVRQSFQRWMMGHEWSPEDAISGSSITSISPVLLPVHLFTFDADANWSCEADPDDDGSWEHRSGRRNHRTTIVRLASNDRRFDMFDDYDHEDFAHVLPTLQSLVGMRTERAEVVAQDLTFDVTLPAALDDLKQDVQDEVEVQIGADDYRNWQINLELRANHQALAYLPFYLVKYTYGGTDYAVLLDGRDAGSGMADEHPECENLKRVANGHYSAAWWSFGIGALALGIISIFGDSIEGNSFYWFLSDLLAACIIVLVVALPLGWLLRRAFNRSTENFHSAVENALATHPVDVNHLLSLEQRRKRERKTWTVIHWTVLGLSLLAVVVLTALEIAA